MTDDSTRADLGSLSGRTLGQYEIGEELGKGGMATVYLARQKSIGRTVAIKIIPPQFTHDETFMQRFEREVKVIADLQHPRVLPVYDYGEIGGRPYIVMAYMAGGTLADLIKKGPLPLDQVVRLAEQIAEGLDHAHRKGVIHRDFKPSNVLLDEHGNAYLADFGIAKINEATIQLTGTGVVGTPAYMAPEMARQGIVTPAIDIYAVGVTLYQMLTGAYPFHGETPLSVLMAHATTPVPDVRDHRPELNEGVANVVRRAMAKDPDERYANAGELAADLRRAAAGQAVAPPPPSATEGWQTSPLTNAATYDWTPAQSATPAPSVAAPPVYQPVYEQPKKRGCGIGIGLAIAGGVVVVGLCLIGLLVLLPMINEANTQGQAPGGGSTLITLPTNTSPPTEPPSAGPTDLPAPTRTPAGGGGPATSLEIANESTETICYVYVSPSTDDSWGSDQLGDSTVIGPGDSFTLNDIPNGEYDLRADDCDRSVLDEHYVVTFGGGVFTWPIRDIDAAVSIQNDSSLDICHVYISSVLDGIWGIDRLDGGTLLSGGSLLVEIPNGDWDYRAEACDETTYWEQYGLRLRPSDTDTWIIVDGDALSG